MLFDHLNQLSENKPQDFDLFFPKPEKGPGIVAYIRNMYKVKRFIQNSAKPPVLSVADKKIKSKEGITAVKLISFNEKETQQINDNALKTGSRFGPTLYLIACCAHVINGLHKIKNKEGDLWIPVPYDGRLKGAIGPLISNCVSFLFYRISKNELNNVGQTVKHLSSQMMNQVKDEIPKKYTMFLNMMRHVPLWLYYFLVNYTGRGVFASFLYTSTGDNFTNLHSLFGEPIRGISMIPALTFPPGLTFVFLKHGDELSLNIAYSPDIIDPGTLGDIEQELKKTLLSHH